MDDFFNKLGSAAKRAANAVSIEVNVAAQEQHLREHYQTLGKLYFQARQNGKVPEGPEFSEQCRNIEATLKRIAELKRANHVSEPYADEEDFVTVLDN